MSLGSQLHPQNQGQIPVLLYSILPLPVSFLTPPVPGESWLNHQFTVL